MLDAPALRGTLDAVRVALTRSSGLAAIPLSAVMLHDRDSIAESLRAVLAAAATVGLRTSSLRGMMSEYRDPSQVERLRGALMELHGGWVRRTTSRLGEAKLLRLKQLLEKPSAEFLDVIQRTRDENAHSQVLRWLLDPRSAPGIAPCVLRGLVSGLNDSRLWRASLDRALERDLISVKREFTIGREWGGDELDRIDLVISGPGFLLAIENKTQSMEGRSQTVAYWRWLSSLPGLRAGLFLTPTGVAAECPDFKPFSYLDLLDCLLNDPGIPLREEENVVLSSYLRTLKNHILRIELRGSLLEGGDVDERTE
jgi:hypothetical protein